MRFLATKVSSTNHSTHHPPPTTKAVSPDGMGSFTNFRKTAGHADGFSFQSIAARAHSRGSVKLASNNPADKAKVETGYLRDERDLETIRSVVSG